VFTFNASTSLPSDLTDWIASCICVAELIGVLVDRRPVDHCPISRTSIIYNCIYIHIIIYIQIYIYIYKLEDLPSGSSRPSWFELAQVRYFRGMPGKAQARPFPW
jgi:hypothetical protein